MKQYEIRRSDMKYRGAIVNVVQDTIVLPNGKEAMREVVVRGEAAAVVPVDDDGRIVLVNQYRHPIKRLSLEIPAGMLEKGEEPIECAARELEEETGLKPGEMEFLLKMHSSIGFCTECLYIYGARKLTQGVQNLDPEEFLTVERYTMEEAVRLITRGAITDGKTIAALLACKDFM